MTSEELETIHDALVFSREHVALQRRSVVTAMNELPHYQRETAQAILAKIDHTLETIQDALEAVHREADVQALGAPNSQN